jgi:hypothetical protein
MASEHPSDTFCVGAEVAFDSAGDMLQFASDYLRTRGHPDDPDNRIAVRQQLVDYRGRAPITRPKISAYLDGHLHLA